MKGSDQVATRRITIKNKTGSGEILEVRIARKTNGRLELLGAGIGQPIYPGEEMDVELPSYEALQLRRVNLKSSRKTAWSQAVPATSTKSLSEKKRTKAEAGGRTMRVGKRGKKGKATMLPKPRKKKKSAAKPKKKKAAPKKKARKKPAKRKPPKPTSRKKRAVKKKAARKTAAPRQRARRPRKKPTCSICGKTVSNIFQHRWKAHPHAVKSSLKKALKKARGSERTRLKTTLKTLKSQIRAARRA